MIKNYFLFQFLYSLIFIFIFPNITFSQKRENVNDYVYYYRDLNKYKARTADETIAYGDSLKKASRLPIEVIYSNLILSKGHLDRNDKDQALIFINEAYNISLENQLKAEELKSLFHLKDVYLKMNLIDHHKETVYKMKQELEKHQNALSPNAYSHLKSDNLIDLGNSHLKNNPILTEKYLKEALSFLNKNTPEGKGLLRVYNNFGNLYTALKNYDKAIFYYEKLLELNKKYGDNVGFKIVAQSNLAINYLAKKEFDKAKEALILSEELVKKYNLTNYELPIKYIFSDYYKAIGDQKEENNINRELLLITKDEKHSSEKAIDTYIEIKNKNFEKKQNKIVEKQSIKLRYVVTISILLLALLFSTIYYFKNKKAQQKIHYENLIDTLKNESNNEKFTELEPIAEVNKENEIEKLSIGISEEKENEIFQKIIEFENEKLFTDAKMSLSILSSYCETNTKYLTYILKKYRNQSYTDYINRLRIKYITRRMYEEPELLKFKINYLAEIAGFSSHSRFAAVFKKENNLSPSELLDRLKIEHQ